LLEHTIKKMVIGNNWQNQQLHMIIDDYFADTQSNLVEPQLFRVSVKTSKRRKNHPMSYKVLKERKNTGLVQVYWGKQKTNTKTQFQLSS
jgi:hypothetical protein